MPSQFALRVLAKTMSRLSTNILSFRIGVGAQEGADIGSILKAADLPQSVMHGDPEFVDLAAERRVWRALVGATGREDIGLLCGLRFPTQAMGMLGYVMANSPNLWVVLEKTCQYAALMGDSMGWRYTRGPSQTKVWIEQWSEWHDPLRYTVDCMMASISAWGTANAPNPIFPTEVGFHYQQPEDDAAHVNIFAPAPVHFGTDVSYLLFDNSQLNQPVIGANREIFETFSDRTERALRRLGEWGTWSDRVRKAMAVHLKGASPTIDAIASELAVSVRTLQLRLQEEGTSFSEVLTGTKSELAQEFLKAGDVRSEEIAYLLGYSEESAFARSFKRWTGCTPAQFRAAAQS